ncbi:hypothetical protein [Sorangium sp. So ce131]|uniref:hypothetical protein n=1 Tax=Sorangium sp. So ce131 TaxID=3133282 RepID=UPI003F624456
MAGARNSSGSSPARKLPPAKGPRRLRRWPPARDPRRPSPALVSAARLFLLSSILVLAAGSAAAAELPTTTPGSGRAPAAAPSAGRAAAPSAGPVAAPGRAPAAAPSAGRAAAPDTIEVRVALSRGAAEEVSAVRLRRLLEIELPDGAALAAEPVGPLGERVATVWIERPTAARLEVQLRLDGRAVVRRQIAVSGLTSDVAARLVAIAASELIRAEMRRARAPRRPPSPRRPTPDEVELASRDLDALTVSAGPYGALVSGGPRALGGVGLSVGLRRLRFTESLFARLLADPSGDEALRWLEAGFSGDYRFWLAASWRLSLGATAAVSSVRLPASAAYGIDGARDTWSARAGLGLGLETRLGGPLWLGLTLDPGVVLRPAPYQDAHGAARAVEGAWLGVGLSLATERRSAAPR